MSRPCIDEGHLNCFERSSSRPSTADDEAGGQARKQDPHTFGGLMRVLAELGKPALEDTWMGQTADEQMSTSKAPRLIVGMRGEWGQEANRGKKEAAIPCLQRLSGSGRLWSFGVGSLLE